MDDRLSLDESISYKLGRNTLFGKNKRRVSKTHLGALAGIAKKHNFTSISIQVRSDKTDIIMRHNNGKILAVKQLSSARGTQLIKHFLLFHCQITSMPFEPYIFDLTEIKTRNGIVKVQGSVLSAFPDGHDLTILIE